jgi:hypothetical protein
VNAAVQSEKEALEALLNSLDPEARSLHAEFDMGEQASEFFYSDIGRYMVGAAHQDLQDAHTKLAKTLPFRWKRIQSLQNDIRVSEMFLLYLRDLVIRGTAAGQALETRDES